MLGRRRSVIRLAALTGLIAIVYAALLVLYAVAGQTTSVAAEQPRGGVLVNLQVVGIEPAAQRIALAVDVYPEPSFFEADGFTLAEDLTVVIDPSTGSRQLSLPAGQVPAVTRLELVAQGDIRTWPLDRYVTGLVVGVYEGSGPDQRLLPTALSMGGRLQGWHLTAESTGPFERLEELQTMRIDLRRSGDALVFAAILLLVLVAMPVITLFVATRTYAGRRAVQPTFMSWMAAMLFATVPLRNFLPGSPPPGSWIDAIVVLWVFVALVASLALYASAWWRQTQPPPPA